MRSMTVGILSISLGACSTLGSVGEKSEVGVVVNTSSQANDPPSGASAEYHFSMAQAYSVEGQTDRAIEEYRIALMHDPHSALIYTRLAAEYVKKGQLSGAIEACKEAVQRDSKFIDAHMILAGLYSTTRMNEEALAEYEDVLKIDPTYEEAAVYKAQVLGELNRLAEGVSFLKAYLVKNTDAAMGWYYLGRMEQGGNHFAAAEKAFKKALEGRPGFSQAALALGVLYEEARRNADAIQVYRQVYEASQDLGAANRIATLLLKEEKYKEAVPYLEAIESVDPEDMNARVKLGLIRMELKDYDGAIASFRAILEKNPDSDRIHYYLGSVYEETKRFREAISELSKITSDSKLFSEAALHVAYLYKTLGDTDQASAYLRKQIDSGAEVAGFYVLSANIEEEAGRVKEAVVVLENGRKKFPKDERILYYLGSLYDRQGRVDLGLAQMEAIIGINPDNIDALNYLGYTWTTQGIRLAEAEANIRKALRLKPDNGYIRDSWGWYLFVRGRTSEAVVELEKAVAMKPNEPTIIEHLADAYVKSNLWEKALQNYEAASRLVADSDLKRKIDEKITHLRSVVVRAGPSVTPVVGERVPAAATVKPGEREGE